MDRVAILLRVATSPTPMRVWGGVGDFAIPIDAIEPAGAVYQGLGEMVGLPAVQQLINGVADRIEFSLSGVSAEILALADDDADVVRGAQVFMGCAFLDESYQLDRVLWLWEGEADTPKISRQATVDAGGATTITRTVSLSVGSALTGRRRPKLEFYTDPHQRRRSADDAFCDRVNQCSQDATVKWP